MGRKLQTVAVIGATGAVGSEIIRLLEERKFPVKSIRCFASSRSLGQSISFCGEQIRLEILSKESLRGIDLAFFAAGFAISEEWIPRALDLGVLCIDSSSAFRKRAPLIIPEINAHAMKGHHGILASPNCAATILLLPLAPLHRLFQAKRIVTSTYQAASGAGAHLLKHLQEETRAILEHRNYPTKLPFPYAFNLYPHNSALRETGYVEEEHKIHEESQKILEDDSLSVSATCIRVPVLRAHSVSANVEFRRPFTLEQALTAVQNAPGVILFEDRASNRFATPFDASGRNEIFCGRCRIDPSQPNTLEFWAVGDQLLKGAALNAVQIAECV